MLSYRGKTTDLGLLDGEVLLFGGAYSNLHATLALFEETRRIPMENRICTGDSVAYCGDPTETALQIKEKVVLTVAGNCENQLAAAAPDCGCGFDAGSSCDLASRAWYPFAVSQTPELTPWFAALPDLGVFQHCGKRYAVIHGGLTDVSRFIWPGDDASVFAEEISAIERVLGPIDGVVAGHSGIPFERRINGVHWINAGVIGMPPHDGRPETRYAVLNEDGVRFHSLSYDHEAAAEVMVQAGLTQGYQHALCSGVWPSEDILPQSLRR